MKTKRLISALAFVLVVGHITHVAAHEVSAEKTHEFVECYGCNNAAAAAETLHTFCEPLKSAAYDVLTIHVLLSTHFNNYSSRAPPTK